MSPQLTIIDANWHFQAPTYVPCRRTICPALLHRRRLAWRPARPGVRSSLAARLGRRDPPRPTLRRRGRANQGHAPISGRAGGRRWHPGAYPGATQTRGQAHQRGVVAPGASGAGSCRGEDVFEDLDAAVDWLKSPNASLGGRTPLSLLDTDIGAESVIDTLGRIEHGVFA